MAKAVFAGKQIEKLAPKQCFTFSGVPYAIFPGFPKNLFVRYSPCNTGYMYRKYK